MKNDNLNKATITAQEMEARYQRAQSLMQGMFSKRMAFNTTLIPHWIDSSEYFWYERELKIGKQFRLVDAIARSNEKAFNHEALANALANASGQTVDADDLPISKIEMSLSPLQLKFSAFGKRWIFSEQKKSCIEIMDYPSDWLISPDGTKAAFARDHNLWVRDLANGEEKALTHDGEPFYCYASAPTAYGANITPPGLEALWSPDSTLLLTLQLDTRSVNTVPMIKHVPQDGSLRPFVIANRRIAFPGDEYVDEYRFLAVNVKTGKQQDAQYHRCPVFRNAGGFFTYRHGWWSEDNRHAYFIDLERGGDHVARLVEFDSHTGVTRVIIEEASPDTCFKLRLDSRMPIHARSLPNSDDILWYSERSGWGHLYLYDCKTGQLKHAVTEGDWLVRDIHHYDPDRRELVIQTANRVAHRHAYYRDICRVNVDTGELTPILSTDHEYIVFDEISELSLNIQISRDTWGSCGVSPSGAYLVTTRSRIDDIPVSLLVDRAGNETTILETADISGLPDNWQWPESVKVKAADGLTDIYGVVYRPLHFSSELSYPILDVSLTLKEGCFFHAGSFTNNPGVGFYYFAASALAELGFIVVDLYGRGTSSRHRDFSADPHPELPDSNNQADRVAGIRQLAERYPYMDINRVGVGGNASTAAPVSGLLGHPDFYKVGVSDSASIDMRLTSAFWGEAYGDLPHTEDNLQHTCSYAKNLKGKLLIMHGMLRVAVNVAHSFSVIDALQKANKDFDMLILPNDAYPMSSYALRRSWDYLVKHLLGAETPTEFELTTSIDQMIALKNKQVADSMDADVEGNGDD